MTRNNEEISDEDQAEIDSYKQLIRVDGGSDLVDSIVSDSFQEAEVHSIEATIDIHNRDAYLQILEEELE